MPYKLKRSRLRRAAAFLNKAMHTKPPIARFANGECFSGGSVILAVLSLDQCIAVNLARLTGSTWNEY